jgi:signal transduction histidine kinase/integral membrane sensor domain MASE1
LRLPLFWLTLGLLASSVYLYGASLVRVEGHYAPPAPLFPPQAVILSVLLLTASRRWWLLLVVAYALRVTSGLVGGIDARFTLVSNVAGVVEPLVGALLLRRVVKLPPRFAGLREVSRYAVCVVAASALGATLGATIRLAMMGSPFWASWQAWFLSDALASLLLTPAILLWAGTDLRGWRSFSPRRAGEIGLLVISMVLVGYFVFAMRFHDRSTAEALAYLPLPVLLWAAVRFGPFGLASALSLLTVFAITGVANGFGPYMAESREANLLDVQLFLACIGVPLFFLAALVHERRQVGLGLEYSERRYRAVVSNFPDGGVLLFGPDQRHLLADGQGLHDAPFLQSSIEGKTPGEAFPAEMASVLESHYAAALAGQRASFDLVQDGHTYFIQVLPITNAGPASGMVVVQDVSEQRRAEVLAELDRGKTAFFNDLSHEFRTPLTLLLAPLEDVLESPAIPLTSDVRQQLEIAHRNAQRLLRLVNTLLDFSRLEAGRLQATFEATDLAAYTAELASVFRSAIEHAGLRLVVDCPSLTEAVFVDRDKWEHIVFNLLSNALKFTFVGQIQVTLHQRGSRVELAVRDTGVGIPRAELPRVFERFHRVQGTLARTEEGTGIGLALVQQLVWLHGGTTSVKSVVGVGSSFRVAIPTGSAHLPAERIRADPDALRRTQVSSSVEEAQRWLAEPGVLPEPAVGGPESTSGERPMRLLVADDNADMRTYAARLLDARGVVETVGNGTEALAVARAWLPDLILADIMMPGLDGLALLHAVRRDPRLRLVPFILLSARADDQARVDGLRAGADDYLIKPFAAAELLARVDGQLESLHVRGEARAAAERRRLARDLHDSVSQTLYAVNMTADALPKLWDIDPEEARAALADLRRLTGAAQAEMRSLLLELRPEALEHTRLDELLHTLVTSAAAKTPADVEASIEPAPPLPPEVQEAFYRIAQEALHNAVKHASPTWLAVRLSANPPALSPRDHASLMADSLTDGAASWVGSLRLQITDTGRGFDPTQAPLGRLGLNSMRERAASIGALFDVTSQPGAGTAVVVTWTTPSLSDDLPAEEPLAIPAD